MAFAIGPRSGEFRRKANLRRAYKQLQDIKERITRGIFNFEEDFPDYRFKAAMPGKEARESRNVR